MTIVERRSLGEGAVRYSLPTPPSANNLYINNPQTGGRFLDPRVKKWRAHAAATILEQGRRTFAGPVSVAISLAEPSRPMDIDGKIKVLLDLLVSVGIIQDDNNKFVRSVSACWAGDKPCEIIIARAA